MHFSLINLFVKELQVFHRSPETGYFCGIPIKKYREIHADLPGTPVGQCPNSRLALMSEPLRQCDNTSRSPKLRLVTRQAHWSDQVYQPVRSKWSAQMQAVFMRCGPRARTVFLCGAQESCFVRGKLQSIHQRQPEVRCTEAGRNRGQSVPACRHHPRTASPPAAQARCIKPLVQKCLSRIQDGCSRRLTPEPSVRPSSGSAAGSGPPVPAGTADGTALCCEHCQK
jgi:hypothetical protein